MGNNYHGHSGLCQFFHDLQYFSDHLRIQRGSRLIKEHHIRIHRHGTCDGDTLFLSTGKAVRVSICFVRKTHTGKEFFCFLRSFLFFHQSQCHRSQHDILFYCLMWKQIELLKYHTDFLTVAVDINLRICNIHTFKKNLSAGWNFQKVQRTKKGRFSGTGWADDCYHFTLTDICGDTVQNLVIIKLLLQSLYLQ